MIFGITRERVRQIEQAALVKLRANPLARELLSAWCGVALPPPTDDELALAAQPDRPHAVGRPQSPRRPRTRRQEPCPDRGGCEGEIVLERCPECDFTAARCVRHGHGYARSAVNHHRTLMHRSRREG